MSAKKWNLKRLRSDSSYWRSCVLIAAAHLDLFDWIGKRKENPKALAAHFGGTAAGWEIFLDALCGMGLIRKHGNTYANSAFAARCLGRAVAASLRPAYDAWDVWGRLAPALLSGKRPAKQDPFLSDHRQTQRLLVSLDLDAREIAPHLIRKLPLGHATSLLDVGGGLGTFSIAFCRRYPKLRATLLEHPRVASLSRRAVNVAGMAKQVRVVGRNILRDPLPQRFDCALVSNVLHAHGRAENQSLLRRLHRGLNPGGQLIVRDVFMTRQRTSPEWGALFSVALFLHTPRGRCYALEEVRTWLGQSGFTKIRGPLPSSPLFFDPDSILIATKTGSRGAG